MIIYSRWATQGLVTISQRGGTGGESDSTTYMLKPLLNLVFPHGNGENSWLLVKVAQPSSLGSVRDGQNIANKSLEFDPRTRREGRKSGAKGKEEGKAGTESKIAPSGGEPFDKKGGGKEMGCTTQNRKRRKGKKGKGGKEGVSVNGIDQSGGEPFDKIIEDPEGAKRESSGSKKVASTTEDMSGSQQEDDNAKMEPLKHNSEKKKHEAEEEKGKSTNVPNGNDHNVPMAGWMGAV